MYGVSEEELIANNGEITLEQQAKNLNELKKLNLDLPFDINNVAPECHACVLSQLKKYENFVDEHGNKYNGKFVVPCKGIQNNVLTEDMRAGFTDEEWESIKAQEDIVKWSKKYIIDENGEPWIARWYQKTVLQCTSRRKTLRISRRAGKTALVVIEILYYLFTHPNIKIVVAGPQKTHTEEIINRVRAFIYANALLANCVTKDISAPYYRMIISNGAELRGFAAGSSGRGGDGSAIRGQDADRLYMEEMHFIAEEAITGAVLPLLQTNENTAMIGFSTPNGMRTPFYSFCKENPACKETHFSYRVLPHWRSVLADRNNFTQEKWEHEFEAEFGSAESGVYNPKYIEQALEDYTYTGIERKAGWKYCIGTDWNEKYGTEIFVIGWNPFSGKFEGVESLHIESSQFTQLTGVKTVLQLNKKWIPEYIYIDAGNGSTNQELLLQKAMKARGHDEITARLVDRLKAYDSGAAIETRDPVTKKIVRKPAKSFMVNASVRYFEQGLIKISQEDTKLEKQLRNYIIERYTPTGNPVYGLNVKKVGDHRLDAFNLALVAFHLEFDDLHAKADICTKAVAVPDPRKVKQDAIRQQENNRINLPQERRLEQDLSYVQSLMNSSMSAKTDKTLNLESNRLGWSTDEEEKFEAQYRQRRISRLNFSRNRPQRSSF